MTAEESITITLTRDEALVLNDLLSDFRDEPAVTIAHPAQRRALWNLACLLDKALPDVFAPDYKLRVEAAKQSLTDDES